MVSTRIGPFQNHVIPARLNFAEIVLSKANAVLATPIIGKIITQLTIKTGLVMPLALLVFMVRWSLGFQQSLTLASPAIQPVEAVMVRRNIIA